jgi:hypothetical protein
VKKRPPTGQIRWMVPIHEQLMRCQLFMSSPLFMTQILYCLIMCHAFCQCHEQCWTVSWTTLQYTCKKKVTCLHALLEISVCAWMHLLMEGTFVPFVRQISMVCAVHVIKMMQQLPTTTGAVHALPHCSSYKIIISNSIQC